MIFIPHFIILITMGFMVIGCMMMGIIPIITTLASHLVLPLHGVIQIIGVRHGGVPRGIILPMVDFITHGFIQVIMVVIIRGIRTIIIM